jgi:hypothetical protein
VIALTLLSAGLLAAPLVAQQMRMGYTAAEVPVVASDPSDGGTILWDQSTLGVNAWADQTFSDFPTFDAFQVSDVSTGGAIWNVNRITTWYTKGAGGGGTLDLWDPLTITTASLNVFPKTGALPDDATDVPPELTVPISLTDIGGGIWEVSADTSGVEELQCITGDFWIGLTPNTSFAVHDQEYHWVVTSTVDDLTALRNPGGGFLIGTTWVPLSTIDTSGTGPEYEACIRLEGDLPAPSWTVYLGTGVVSPTWGSTPTLVGAGVACGGELVSLTGNFNGIAPDITYLVIGPAIFLPFKGGVMVPDDALLILVPVGPSGDFGLAGAWPAGIPPGFSFFFQTWTNEAGGVGWSGSDGLEVVSQ